MSSDPGAVARDPLERERRIWHGGIMHVAGVDEAGRGPLAGPVVAAAVILPHELYITGVKDSKRLSPEQRDCLYDGIVSRAVAIGTGVVDHEQIDRVNILQATFQAMRLALQALTVHPGHVLVDGNRFVEYDIPWTAIIDGDAICHTISAASIIAKVTRDRIMLEYDNLYPGYGFARNKGYGTLEHRTAIQRLGTCPIHRRTFVHLSPISSSGEE